MPTLIFDAFLIPDVDEKKGKWPFIGMKLPGEECKSSSSFSFLFSF